MNCSILTLPFVPSLYFLHATYRCTFVRDVRQRNSENAPSLSYQVPPCLFHLIFSFYPFTCWLLTFSVLPVRLLNCSQPKYFQIVRKIYPSIASRSNKMYHDHSLTFTPFHVSLFQPERNTRIVQTTKEM